MEETLKEQFQTDGRCWIRSAGSPVLPNFELELDGPGVRLSLSLSVLERLEPGTDLARSLDPLLRPVRVVAFDKTAQSNWSLGWHQDRVVAVCERHACAGFSNWGRKQGVWHAEPPLEIMESMVFARLHIDPCTIDSGATQIALGSHRFGKVRSEDAKRVADACLV
jgi:hypothetical protein